MSESHPIDGVPPTLAARLRGALEPGERLAWAGMPSPGLEALSTLPAFAFGLVWSGLTFPFFAVAAGLAFGLHEGDGSTPPLVATGLTVFLLPFVGVGVAMLSAPPLAWLRAMLTVHAVSDRRLITVRGGPRPSVGTVLPATLSGVARGEPRAGRGTLTLRLGHERDRDGDLREVTRIWRGVPGLLRAEAAVLALRPRA